MGCNHDCSSCSNCKNMGQIELTPGELDILEALGQYAFLPVARQADDPTPVYLENQYYTREQYSLILQVLEKKGLISLDFDKPLGNLSSQAYALYPICGSMALTLRGQQVLDILQRQGLC